ncbi:MAG TPA: glycosyltransferase [Candidatus Limnocylindrales bacterium]
MSVATWTILIATIGERRELFARLLDVLLPQVERHDGRVNVLAYYNNGEPSLPEIRQRMVEATTADYLCCIDDDDLVPDHYVADILTALESKPDYVGFQVQCYQDGEPTAIAYHSLKHDGWRNEADAYYRDLSHLNPIRTSLAQQVSFRRTRQGRPEDREWVAQLRGRVKTEVFIDKVMYLYFYSTSRSAGIGSRWKMPSLIQRQGFEPLPVDSPYFAYYPGSVGG